MLLTRLGTLPGEIRQIVLDTSAYEKNGYLLPQRAVLFLDDLPLQLPHPTAFPSPAETVRTLLHWFRELPYFRHRRVVGTLRLEDVTARPDWLEILPALQQEFELLRLKPLAGEGYRKLWRGMERGAISRSAMLGIEQFAIQIEDAFIDAVAERPVDPESVATFVQQSILHARSALTAENADNFQGSAVETWLAETWPTLLHAHGVSARVFYTLARFLEAGLRPDSGFAMSLGPFWLYHEALGPALCEREGQAGADYLSSLASFLQEGYAVGEPGHHVRPAPDYLLQAPHLPEVELALPEVGWFAERALLFDPEERMVLAMHLGAANADSPLPALDHSWNIGWSLGLGIRSQREANSSTRRSLRETAIAQFSAMDSSGAEPDWVRDLFAVFLLSQGIEETDPDIRKRLLDQTRQFLGTNSPGTFRPLRAALNLQITDLLSSQDGPPSSGESFSEIDAALQLAVPLGPLDSAGWALFGGSFGNHALAETDSRERKPLLDRAVATVRKAIAAEPDNATYKYELGGLLLHTAFCVRDLSQRAALLDEALPLLRAEPTAAYGYGRALSMKADAEPDSQKRLETLEEAVQSYRQALAADPGMSQAWTSLATALGVGRVSRRSTAPEGAAY